MHAFRVSFLPTAHIYYLFPRSTTKSKHGNNKELPQNTRIFYKRASLCDKRLLLKHHYTDPTHSVWLLHQTRSHNRNNIQFQNGRTNNATRFAFQFSARNTLEQVQMNLFQTSAKNNNNKVSSSVSAAFSTFVSGTFYLNLSLPLLSPPRFRLRLNWILRA